MGRGDAGHVAAASGSLAWRARTSSIDLQDVLEGHRTSAVRRARATSLAPHALQVIPLFPLAPAARHVVPAALACRWNEHFMIDK